MEANVDFVTVPLRVPLKFGAETVTGLCDALVEVEAYGSRGLGETPLSASWGWPSAELSYSFREERMKAFCRLLAKRWTWPDCDPMCSNCLFIRDGLPKLLEEFNAGEGCEMPQLAALICASAFDIALHDAFGRANGRSSYATYSAQFMKHDLSWFFGDVRFAGLYPSDFFVQEVPDSLPVWHLVGGKDLLRESDRIGGDPDDGYPVSLEKWIERDGLTSLKIKLTGDDAEWDYRRMVEVGELALPMGVEALSPDFNCRAGSPDYVAAILDRLAARHREIYDALLYVEQPFPYDIEANRIDVGEVVKRKDIFMDESAHDWRFVEIGRTLGWNGVALKTCKTQTGALLSGCWARMNGMKLMVQDLTNPRHAMCPHVLLAAHFGTIRGVECNAAQFCPAASVDFEKRFPGLYERRGGVVRIDGPKRKPGLGVES